MGFENWREAKTPLQVRRLYSGVIASAPAWEQSALGRKQREALLVPAIGKNVARVLRLCNRGRAGAYADTCPVFSCGAGGKQSCEQCLEQQDCRDAGDHRAHAARLGTSAEQILNGFYNSYVLLAVPLFLFSAWLMNVSKMTDQLLRFCDIEHSIEHGELRRCRVPTIERGFRVGAMLVARAMRARSRETTMSSPSGELVRKVASCTRLASGQRTCAATLRASRIACGGCASASGKDSNIDGGDVMLR
ncbi:MAG TPA: hypothetical protein VM867_03445 [Xanthobacteraceae bacterium]|nr:hypothetical protein [Xanthobacteraceae bacterium]